MRSYLYLLFSVWCHRSLCLQSVWLCSRRQSSVVASTTSSRLGTSSKPSCSCPHEVPPLASDPLSAVMACQPSSSSRCVAPSGDHCHAVTYHCVLTWVTPCCCLCSSHMVHVVDSSWFWHDFVIRSLVWFVSLCGREVSRYMRENTYID